MFGTTVIGTIPSLEIPDFLPSSVATQSFKSITSDQGLFHIIICIEVTTHLNIL